MFKFGFCFTPALQGSNDLSVTNVKLKVCPMDTVRRPKSELFQFWLFLQSMKNGPEPLFEKPMSPFFAPKRWKHCFFDVAFIQQHLNQSLPELSSSNYGTLYLTDFTSHGLVIFPVLSLMDNILLISFGLLCMHVCVQQPFTKTSDRAGPSVCKC